MRVGIKLLPACLLMHGVMTFGSQHTLAQTAGGALPAGTIQLYSPPWLMNPSTRQDIGLTNEQMMQLARIQTHLTNAFNIQLQQISNVAPAVRDARVRELTNEYNTRFSAASESILTPQQQRLQQFHHLQPYWHGWR